MANYQNLKAAISAAIRTNGNQEITGQVLQDVLNSIVSVIGANYTFAGVATPATNPGTPDQNVMYLAMDGGTYTNFNGTVLPAGISLLMWNGTWTSETVMYGDGGVFDISVYKSSGGTLATFADLAAALNGGNNIPVGARKGGMSVKFVQTSDNNYVQFRFMLSGSFTSAQFTNPDNWQGVSKSIKGGSLMIPASCAVSRKIQDVAIEQGIIVWEEGSIDTTNPDNYGNDITFEGRCRSTFIPLSALRYIYSYGYNIYAIYNANKEYLGRLSDVTDTYTSSDFTTLYETAAYIRVVEKNSENRNRWEYGITGMVGDSLLNEYFIIPQNNEVIVNERTITLPYSHIYVKNNLGKYKRYLTANTSVSYTLVSDKALVMSTIDGAISIVLLSDIDLEKCVILAVCANGGALHLHPSLAAASDNVRIKGLATAIDNFNAIFKPIINSNEQYLSLINNSTLIWESGTITNGIDADNASRKRTIGYVPIDNLQYLTAYGSIFIVLYDSSKTFINSNTFVDWNKLTKEQILESYPNSAYFRLVKKVVDVSDVIICIDSVKTDNIKKTQKSLFSAVLTNGEFVDIASNLSNIQNVAIITSNPSFALYRTDRISAIDGVFAPILNKDDLYLLVKTNSGYQVAINILSDTVSESYFSGTDKKFNSINIYSSGWLADNVEHKIDLTPFDTSRCGIIFVFRKSNGSNISVSDYSSIGFVAKSYRYSNVSDFNARIKNPIAYLGKEISLLQESHVFNYDKVFGISGTEPFGFTQSMACYGDYIFTANTNNTIVVFDKEWNQVQSIAFEPTPRSHSNSLAFTNVFYSENDEYPLLLSSICDTNNSEFGIYVIRITRENNTFAINVLNKITSDKPCYSWCCSDKMLFGITYTNSEDGYLDINSRPVVIGWEMPNLLTTNLELLRENAVIDFTIPYYGIIQDVMYRGGKLYQVMFMYGSYVDATMPRGIWVIDPQHQDVETIIPFYAGREFEGVMIMDNKLYISDRRWETPQDFNVYKFNF